MGSWLAGYGKGYASFLFLGSPLKPIALAPFNIQFHYPSEIIKIGWVGEGMSMGGDRGGIHLDTGWTNPCC